MKDNDGVLLEKQVINGMPKPKPKRGKSGAAKQTRRERDEDPTLDSRLLADVTFAEDLPFDDEKQRLFLGAYLKTASISRACDLSGTTSVQLAKGRKDDPDFNRLVLDIQEHHTQTLEDTAFLRACHGWPEPVFYNGKQCGSKRRFSNALTIFLLKARRPEVYNIDAKSNQQAPEDHARRIRELTIAANAQFDDPSGEPQDDADEVGSAPTTPGGP